MPKPFSTISIQATLAYLLMMRVWKRLGSSNRSGDFIGPRRGGGSRTECMSVHPGSWTSTQGEHWKGWVQWSSAQEGQQRLKCAVRTHLNRKMIRPQASDIFKCRQQIEMLKYFNYRENFMINMSKKLLLKSKYCNFGPREYSAMRTLVFFFLAHNI